MKRPAGGVLSVVSKRIRSMRAQWLFLALVAGFTSRGMAQCDYQVTSLADSGAGTLRAGLATAPTTTDICFSVQGTITLLSPLQITAPVIITGTSGVTISGNNSVGIFVIYVPSESSTPVVTISGLTLSGGNATAGNNIYGGAIWVQAGPTSLSNMTITGNTAESGGAIYNGGTVTIQDSTVSNNTATTGAGGAIVNNGGTLSLLNTTVSGNSSTTGSGGALDNSGYTQVTGGTFQGNSADYGGAIDNETYGTLTISGGTAFNSNIATLNGGAIENYGTANITAALFNANQAQGNSDLVGCGGAICNESTLKVTESTFVANTTTGSGGGIESDSGASITLQDDTISGNTAGYTGSGLDLEQSSSAPVVENTVIAGNTAIQGQTNPDCFGCAATTPAGDFIGGTANLGPLTNNGGPTLTMMPLPAGNLCGTGVPGDTTDTTDQRGFSRLMTNGAIDIGAVQSHYSSVSYSTQPSNTLINQTITPAVGVQVIEVDGKTTNYPQGVPVTVSLIPPQGVNATLSGTLTQIPTVVNQVTAALFPDLSVNAVGGFQLLATDAIQGNSGSTNAIYNATSATFQITPVVKLQWTPAPATYGPLPASELNATATVNGAAGTGTFVYTFVSSGATINVGQIYPVSSYSVQVAFTPTSSSMTYTLQTTLQITQAAPVLGWATPAAIYTSTALSAAQLDATATGVTGAALPGTFVYTPAAGTKLTAGSHALSTTFTPTDTTDYTTATDQVTIQVNAVTASTAVIQTSANPITFGQSETFTAVVTGSDGNPFSGGTAAFTVDGVSIGSAAVVNGSASVTDATLTGGTHQEVLTYTIATQTLTNTVTLTVNKASPTLTWATPAPVYTSTALSATQLDATATGVAGATLPGTFVYTPASGTKLSAGSHALSTTFTPTDTTDYTTATDQVTIQVNAVTASTAVIQTSANPITFGQSETFTAVVTGSDGNPFSGGTAAFAVDGVSIGSAPVVNGSAIVTDATLTGGTHQVVLTYTNATQTLTNTITLTVNKASPTLAWATPAPIYTSTALSATQLDATATGVTAATLPGTFAYTPTAGTKLNSGPHSLSTTFTPTDTTDYATATDQVTIQVNAVTASTAVIQTSANPITFGQSETFTAVVTGSDGNPFSGGTAAFTVDGVSIGSAAVVNGSASVTDATLTGGARQVVLTYTNATQTLTGNATITVNKASPTLAWATPAPIYTSTALGATQLDATATGVAGATLPGTFVYTPAAGTKLTAGPHALSTTFTPTDATDYTTATDQVTIQVNAVTASTAVIQTSANPITFGQSETFTAVVTGSDGNPLSGGTAAFTVDGASIGSAPVVNGSASVTDATLTGGTHQVVLTYTNATQTLTNTITLTVNKASPTLTWATPAPIYTSTALSATQLDATATGVTAATLPGTFVYTPAAGTKLTVGPHSLSTTFTPTDATDYATAVDQVTIQVNAVTASTAVIQPSANPITFGQGETFTAVVTGSDGNPLSGGTAAFTVDGVSIGSAAVVNGSASVTDATLTGGTHQVVLTYTNATQTLTGNATITVNKASPTLTWATPAPIYTSTALSATQLDATATGVTGASLSGTAVYNPPAGTLLTNGAHALSVVFTPTDAVDYTTATAQVTITVGYTPLSISTITPATVTLSTTATTVAITGGGFTPTTVAELNGTPLPTTVSGATGLSATIAPSVLTAVGVFNLTVYDSTSNLTSNALTLTVTAPTVDLTVTPPQEPTSGEQPVIGLLLNAPYPVALSGTMTLSFTPSGSNGVDDPAVQFATGGRTLTFTVPAGSTTTPQVALQTGTVAGTIDVTLSLLADGVDVTPAGVSPITLQIKPAVPVITSVTFTNSATGQLTVVINGYSNTRDMSGADFAFTGTGANSLGSATASVTVSSDFTPWYTSTTSDQYGSEFSYSQSFQLSRPDSGITGVSVTLTNSIGTSESVSSQ